MCKSSKGESIIENFLKNNNIDYVPQYILNCPKTIRISGRIKVDFMININEEMALIEYNGEQHYENLNFFYENKTLSFQDQVNRDLWEQEYCKLNKINLLVIKYNEDIISKLTQFIQSIKNDF